MDRRRLLGPIVGRSPRRRAIEDGSRTRDHRARILDDPSGRLAPAGDAFQVHAVPVEVPVFFVAANAADEAFQGSHFQYSRSLDVDRSEEVPLSCAAFRRRRAVALGEAAARPRRSMEINVLRTETEQRSPVCRPERTGKLVNARTKTGGPGSAPGRARMRHS